MADLGEPPDPAEVARLRAELLHVGGAARRLGFLLAGLGVLAALLRGTLIPTLPELVPLVLIVTALGLMLIGVVRRVRYHLRRARGL